MDFMKEGGWSEDQSGSSPEQARENEVMVESPSSKKRFYKCTFCKRGFTNAQALGGHMNIHRKDRQRMGSDIKRSQPSSSSRPHSSASKPCLSARVTNDFLSKSIDYSFFEVQSISPLRMNYEFMDANLSLRIGNGHVEDVGVDGVIKGNEHEENGIDLELRLGYFHG